MCRVKFGGFRLLEGGVGRIEGSRAELKPGQFSIDRLETSSLAIFVFLPLPLVNLFSHLPLTHTTQSDLNKKSLLTPLTPYMEFLHPLPFPRPTSRSTRPPPGTAKVRNEFPSRLLAMTSR